MWCLLVNCGIRVRSVLHFRPFKHIESSLYHLLIVCYGYVDNEDRKRMNALQALADDEYRQDIISNNIGDWIINGQSFLFQWCLYEIPLSEYRSASKRLGDARDEDPYTLYSRRSSPVFDIISRLLGELPIVCSLLYSFLQLSYLTLRIPLFRYSAPFPHWLILADFPWLLLPFFNNHQGLSAGHSRLFLDPTRIFVGVFRLSGRCMKLSWLWMAWATEL